MPYFTRMKKLLFSLLFFFSLTVQAQLDTEHWFAPMAAKTSTAGLEGYLYLSTNEITPFTVQIFNNNTLYSSVQLSKGNPQQVSIPNNFMVAVGQSNLFVPNTMGLQVKGSKKFFANYRFSIPSHAEIITSKGAAGIGKKFYAAMAPITGTSAAISSTIGVIATEDNTTLTITPKNPAVVFSNNQSPGIITVTLNKGQSYIIDAVSSIHPANTAGLIGSKIESTKPISVTNGNFNGIYTNLNFTNNDILMDQSVPVERLGKNFVVIKGNGSNLGEMESALVVATEDNTTITVNGAATGIVLNTGEYYMVPGSAYINQGNAHYNVAISTNKNAYVYQFLAGSVNSNEYATGGMNFIPPLSCFMPNKIDEIGTIQSIGFAQYETKLNIITQVGAAVTVNSAPLPASSGPYPVTGNPDWVTYEVLNITGNITVNSTKSVTAGLAAGSGAVGYGGYFSGFSSVPAITKIGDCYFGVLLQVDNSYDAYQWYLNGVPIAGATGYSINPELYGAGAYTCMITKINCESKLTNPYDYTLCPPITNTIYHLGLCSTKIIAPAFTSSSQGIVSANTSIIVPPQFGTVAINPITGQITYSPNTNLIADVTDTFVYYIEGNGNPADFEYFRITLHLDYIAVNNASLTACGDLAGVGNFDLTSVSVTAEPGAVITYFTDFALTNAISAPANFNSGNATIYANVTSPYGCSKVAQIVLNVIPSPNFNTTNFNGALCDDNFDGIVSVNFSTVTAQMVNNYPYFNVKYYLTQADAIAGNSNFLPNIFTYSAPTTIFIRVESNSNCPTATGESLLSIGNKIPLLTNEVSTEVCDADLSGSEDVNLNSFLPQFTAAPGVVALFFTSLANAQSATSPVSAVQTITNSAIFYVRFESSTACPNTAKITVTLKRGKKSDVLYDQKVCTGKKTVLNAGPGFTSYVWSTGASTPSIMVGAGTYYVDLGFNGCVYRQTVLVSEVPAPTITSIQISGSSATINVSGGTPPYQYSLNGIDYQTSNVFTGLTRGPKMVYVTSADGCEPIVKEFLMINLINAITPNGDGHNDILNYEDLKIKDQVSMEIADRYGAPVYKSSDKKYVWDGKLGGRHLSTGTYWYIIRWIEPDTKLPISYSGWFLIKNRE